MHLLVADLGMFNKVGIAEALIMTMERYETVTTERYLDFILTTSTTATRLERLTEDKV
jgi:hypothetical protein